MFQQIKESIFTLSYTLKNVNCKDSKVIKILKNIQARHEVKPLKEFYKKTFAFFDIGHLLKRRSW